MRQISLIASILILLLSSGCRTLSVGPERIQSVYIVDRIELEELFSSPVPPVLKYSDDEYLIVEFQTENDLLNLFSYGGIPIFRVQAATQEFPMESHRLVAFTNVVHPIFSETKLGTESDQKPVFLYRIALVVALTEGFPKYGNRSDKESEITHPHSLREKPSDVAVEIRGWGFFYELGGPKLNFTVPKALIEAALNPSQTRSAQQVAAGNVR